MIRTQLCRHIKTNGRQCGSPALEDGSWCYFHHRLHQTHRESRRRDCMTESRMIPGLTLNLFALEDLESVQLAIFQVINALANGTLLPKAATPLLYGLQIAATNAARLRSSAPPEHPVIAISKTSDGLEMARNGTVLDIEHRKKQDEEDRRTDENFEKYIKKHGIVLPPAALASGS